MKSENQKLIEAYLAGETIEFRRRVDWCKSGLDFDEFVCQLISGRTMYRIKPKTITIKHRKYLAKSFNDLNRVFVTNYVHTLETDEEHESHAESLTGFIKWLEPKQTMEIEIES